MGTPSGAIQGLVALAGTSCDHTAVSTEIPATELDLAQPENPQEPGPQRPPRDERGRLLPGGPSLNFGGRPSFARELRELRSRRSGA